MNPFSPNRDDFQPTQIATPINVLMESAPQKFAEELDDHQTEKDKLLAIIEEDRKRIETLEKQIQDLQITKPQIESKEEASSIKQDNEQNFDENKDDIKSEPLASSKIPVEPHKRLSSTELKKLRKQSPNQSVLKLFKNIVLSPPKQERK